MNLRFKILSGFLILAVMLCAAGAASIYELNRIGHSVNGLLEKNYRSIVAAKEMIEALERQDSGVLMLMSGNWEAGRATLEEADRAFAQAFGTAKSNITITGATILSNVEGLAPGLLFWRAATHWMGGVGIIIFVLAVMPSMGAASMVLYRSEVSPLVKESFHYRTKKTLTICSTSISGSPPRKPFYWQLKA